MLVVYAKNASVAANNWPAAGTASRLASEIVSATSGSAVRSSERSCVTLMCAVGVGSVTPAPTLGTNKVCGTPDQADRTGDVSARHEQVHTRRRCGVTAPRAGDRIFVGRGTWRRCRSSRLHRCMRWCRCWCGCGRWCGRWCGCGCGCRRWYRRWCRPRAPKQHGHQIAATGSWWWYRCLRGRDHVGHRWRRLRRCRSRRHRGRR